MKAYIMQIIRLLLLYLLDVLKLIGEDANEVFDNLFIDQEEFSSMSPP